MTTIQELHRLNAYDPPLEKPPEPQEFNSLEELFNIDFVKRSKEWGGFLRFSKSGNHLMVEHSPNERHPEGSFYVIGFLDNPDDVDLPKWQMTPMQRACADAWNRGDLTYVFEGKTYKVTNNPE